MWFAVQAVGKVIELASQPIGQALQLLAVMFALVHAVLAFRRVYGRVRFSVVRIAFVMSAYLVAFIVAMIAIVLPLVFRQMFTRPT
jgi:succinate dehydrogenase hydrophobic anchor subunit